MTLNRISLFSQISPNNTLVHKTKKISFSGISNERKQDVFVKTTQPDLINNTQRAKTIEIEKILNTILDKDKNGDNVILSTKKGFVENLAKKIATQKTIIIGTTGESASGKSTLANIIKNLDNPNITYITTDSYFKDISDKIQKAGSFDNLVASGFDIDSPENFYTKELKRNLEDLKKGKTTKGPKYLPNGTGISKKNALEYEPNRVIFLEGTIAHHPKIEKLLDAKIYVDTPEDIRFSRFINRAQNERNQTFEEASEFWEYIKNAGKKYVQPFKKESDVVLDGTSNAKSLENLVKSIDKLLQ